MNNNNVYLNLLLIVILLLLLNCNLEDKNNDIIDKTKQYIIDYKNYLILIIVVVVLVILYYYNYDWINKKVNNMYNNDDSDDDSDDNLNKKLNTNIKVIEEVKPNITLYYANWCPHCNSLKPIWNKFFEKNKDNGKYDIKAVDCSESCLNPNVEGYPTILLTKSNGEVSDFSGEIKNEKDLENYVFKNFE